MTTYELKDRTVIIPNDDFPEYYSYRYHTPFKFKGTEEELLAYLREERAISIHSDFVYSGQHFQHFTIGFDVTPLGHDDLWEITEHRAVDI